MPRILALAGVMLLFCGCAATTPSPAPANVEFDNAVDGAKVTVKRGGELKVILDANATTGFQWQTSTPIAPVLSPIGERIWVLKGDPRTIGAGGINVFRFRAEQAGTLTLQFDLKRPWETVPPDKSIRYTVTVE